MEETREVPVIAAEVEEAAAQPANVPEIDPVMAALEKRVRDLEAAMGDLRTVAASAAAAATASVRPAAAHGRKTLGAPMVSLLAKQGVSFEDGVAMQAGALDAAMGALSVEQRIAVKSQMMRAGLL